MSTIRVMILAHDLLARAGIAALLDTDDNLLIVGQSAGGEQLEDDIHVYAPDIIIYDAGYDTLEDDLSILNEMGITVLVLLADADNLSLVYANIDALRTFGILKRDISPKILSAAIPALDVGLTIISEDFAQRLFTTIPPPLDDNLTNREYDVLQLLAEGLSNKAIGERLFISPNTVKFHVNAILGKLNARSRTQAVVRATQLGLILL
jgi:two-component system, NarL family, nitrate/nitrite response regulator NarL